MKSIKILLVLLVALAAMSSCQKEAIPNPDPQTMDDLIITPAFDWKTTADYDFTLKGTSTHVVQILSADGTVVYKKGLMMANVPYVVHLTLPSYVKDVSLRFFGQSVNVQLASKSISYNFN
jgi:hypothetical protein